MVCLIERVITLWVVHGVPHRENNNSNLGGHGMPHRERVITLWVVHGVPHGESNNSLSGPWCASWRE